MYSYIHNPTASNEPLPVNLQTILFSQTLVKMKVSSPESEELKIYYQHERNMIKTKKPHLLYAAANAGGISAVFNWERSKAPLSLEQELEGLRQCAYEARPTWWAEWEKQRRRNGLNSWF